MKLIAIPEEKYYKYRIDAMFDCYKWDPQFYDKNTLAKYVLILSKEENENIIKLTENLDKETVNAERFINKNYNIAKKLDLPKKLLKQIKNMSGYDESKNIRLMRYDFHPSENGEWVVTEVNSDVPGGFAESSLLPNLAKKYIDNNNLNYKCFGDILTNEIIKKVKSNGTIMLVHCTCFSDDRQVMQYLGDKLELLGFKVIYGAADHIKFENGKAFSILHNNKEEIDLIFRFTPIEWLIQMKTQNLDGYFNTTTCCCNHPIAVFAQTKKFPLIWDDLEKKGLNFETWRKLLPLTKKIKNFESLKNNEEYIFKPVYGRVGEKISIKEACVGDEYSKILKDVKKHKNNYLAQKRFTSKPIITDKGECFHLCLGSYTIEGKHAGYYARINTVPRIDSYSADIPVLIEDE